MVVTFLSVFWKGLIEEAGLQLDSVDGITAVHARYYDLCSKYHKVRCID